MTRKEFLENHYDAICTLYRQYDVENLGILESIEKVIDTIADELANDTLMNYSDFFNPVPSSDPEVAMSDIKNKIIHDSVVAFYKKMDRDSAVAILNGAVILKRSVGMLWTEVKIPIVGGIKQGIMEFMSGWNSAHPDDSPIQYRYSEDSIYW